MEPKVIIYLIIGLFYLFAQYKKNQKKREDQRRQEEGGTAAEDTRTIQPPTPQKDRDTFRDIFEKAQQQIQQAREPKKKKEEPKPQFKPAPRREYEVVKPMKEEIDENYQDTSMKDMIAFEQPRDLRTTVAAATVSYEEDITNPILDNFDLRNALIAQIILERPEF